MKPTIDTLESIAISNQLDLLYLELEGNKGIPVSRITHIRELIKQFENRYEQVTKAKYIYQDTRGVYTD